MKAVFAAIFVVAVVIVISKIGLNIYDHHQLEQELNACQESLARCESGCVYSGGGE